jgi:ssDNA-binding Zn-finger/Zn-ribbon topoisomerase 1
MNRHTGIAPYNARCPICGHECYQDIIPTGAMYTCPKCGIAKMTEPVTAEEFDKGKTIKE